MPMTFRTLEEVDYIVQKLQPMLEKRLEAKGFVALFWSDTGWVRFFSKDPVIGPDDLRKTKLFVEAGSPAYVDLYRSVRLNPVPLEAVDILPNLQTGLINAAPLPPSYALAGQVDRAAPNMLDLAWAPLVGALVVSKKTWDAIPPETRDAMRQAAVEAGAKMKAEGRRESVESVEAMRKRGLTVHPLDAGGRGPMAARDGGGLSQNPGIHCAGGHFRRGDEPVGHLSRRTAEEMSGTANPPAPAPDGWRRWLRVGEDSLVTLALGALVILPLLEIVLRRLFHSGISGATAIQQHLTLVISLLGGMLAARDRRLLSLSTLSQFLKGRWQVFARVYSSAVAAAISVFLCVAAAQLAASEREGGSMMAYQIPIWTVQLIMPVGFAVIALRLLWNASGRWGGRLAALLLAGGIAGIGLHPFVAPERLVMPGLIGLLAAVILGAPIFALLGGAALILFWGDGTPIASLSLTHYSMVTNPTLPTVPLFTLAGYFLAEGGASQTIDPGLSRAAGPASGRAGDCRGHRVRVLHFVHGSVGRDDPRAGRVADAGVAGGGIHGALRARAGHGVGRPGFVVPAVAAVDSLRRGGQRQRGRGRSDD